MDLDNKILEVIKENLPEAVVGSFKDRIDELEKLAAQVEPLNKELRVITESLKVVIKERNELQSYKSRLEEITRLEGAIRAKKDSLSVKEQVLEYKEQMINVRVEDHKQMFATVFKNTTLRNTIFTNSSTSDKENCMKGEYSDRNTTITKEQE